jgi:hypothetical protein
MEENPYLLGITGETSLESVVHDLPNIVLARLPARAFAPDDLLERPSGIEDTLHPGR